MNALSNVTEWLVPNAVCPSCKRAVEACATAGNTNPKIGDILPCAHCGSVLEFTEGLGLRAMSRDDYAELEPDVREELDMMTGAFSKVRMQAQGGAN